MAGTAQRQQSSRRWVWAAALCGGGLAIVLIGAGLALDSGTRRVETFGLSDLVDGPARDSRILTPSEEARARFNDEYRANYKSESRAEISGTKLMLRAIRELNPREREIRIQDAVRLLRAHPEVKPKVYAMVDTYLANNPQMAAYGAAVKRDVDRLLGETPKRRLDYLEY